MAPADHYSSYSNRSSRRKRSEADKLLERMHIRLGLAVFKAQYGYETFGLDTLESKLIRHSPPSPYNRQPAEKSPANRHSRNRVSPHSATSHERNIVRSSPRRQIRKEYNDYVLHTPRSLNEPRTSPHRYYKPRQLTPRQNKYKHAYPTPTSPLYAFHPSIKADISAKRSTTPNNGSLTPPRSVSPAIPPTLHRSYRNPSPTPQQPSYDGGSLWDQCGLVRQPSVDETDAANVLMGLWCAK
ncbi:hypothetical protein NQZ79_g3568 [Umbelopsis isabellina]|nr:hypothetical protein NQZ79_g3568 [Umbelopsis isabellina]